MKFRGLLCVGKKSISLALVFTFVAEAAAAVLMSFALFVPSLVEAAVVTLEPSPNTTAAGHTMSGTSLVFIDDEVGYKFHRYGLTPSNGMCVYRKTIDGGTSWGAPVVVDSQTDCTAITIWYDGWTPGDTGTSIHIASYDTGDDEMFYNRLDTVSDTLLLPTATSTMLGLATSYAAGTNNITITKGTNGRVYMTIDDSNGTFIRGCTTNCNIGSNWTAVGTPPQGNANSWSLLMPQSGGNIMLINRSTGGVMRSSIWNGATWSAFATIDSAASVNTTYDVGMAATIDRDTFAIYLAYAANNDSFTVADHDIRTRKYSSGAWASRADVLTNVAGRGILHTAIARDEYTGNIYVGYTIRSTIGTAATARVHYKLSSSDMTSWDAEQGPFDTAAGDYYGLNMNLMSAERIYATWFNNTAGVLDIFGETLADIGPDALLSSFNTQISELRSNQQNLYLGGTFLLQANNAQSVTSVTLSENGTVDAQNNLKNIKLFYDLDTTAPYDCTSESYNGGEAQLGLTAASGFSGTDGIATFNTSPIALSATQSLCAHVVLDIEGGALDGDTLEIEITNPEVDIVLSGGTLVFPGTPIVLPGTTTIVESNLVQTGFHWRLNNGSEVTASSATAGVENTALTALQKNQIRRVRLGVTNEGSTSTLAGTYELEYAETGVTCEDATLWTAVGTAGALFSMAPSANISDGDNTTDIPVLSGGVTNGGTTFVTPNGALRDTTNTSGAFFVNPGEFVEFEYSLTASSTTVDGQTYCFRMARSGVPLATYELYPRATVAANTAVSAFGTQAPTAVVQETELYSGGGFAIVENTSTRSVTSITLSELGTIDADVALANLKIFYEFDTTAPYNCQSVSYTGSESQYGTTSVLGFSGTGETSTFTDSIVISTTSAFCAYVLYDITGLAQNGDVIDIGIASPNVDVVTTDDGSVSPSSEVNIPGETTIVGPIISQTSYHWRTDDGSETDASSATGGSENTPVSDFTQDQPIRLRIGVANTGSTDTSPTRYQLEYAPKITTCTVGTVWTPVDAQIDGWDSFDSTFLTNGANTTNIAVATGGVSNGAATFFSSNGGIRDTEAITGSTTLPSDNFLELEYSITSTQFTSFATTYCFRVTASGVALNNYDNFPELTTAAKRDYKIQRGSTQVSGTSVVLSAGVAYEAPASSSLAFVRITNSHNTGAGPSTGVTAAQNADDITAQITSAQNLGTSFTISRPATALAATRVDWEIIEFIGRPGTDNEMKVRSVGNISYTTTSVVATGTVVSTVADDAQVVVFITGVSNRNTSRNYYASQVTAEWDATTNAPVFRRGANGSSIVDVSYAVVEFTGANWKIQRAEHRFTAAGTVETEAITAVNSLARTFLHVQKRMGATTNVVHFGHVVWLSSIGSISFELESLASLAVEHTSVAWVIENTQTGLGSMIVQRSNGTTVGGTGPLSLAVAIPTPVAAVDNTSISASTRTDGANTTYPRPMAGFTITSSSTYQLWRSNTGSNLVYRTEIIEWPAVDLTLRQNYYRFYVDNNELTPSDPWPVGPTDLGENTSLTINDEPLGQSERLRLRMTIRVANASMPAGLQNYRLQYGLRATTCSAIPGGSWVDVGAAGSGAVWRGYSATGTTDGTALSTNPASSGDLLISVADIAGTLEHENISAVNQYSAPEGSEVEYDWYLEQNGADAQSTYCFRTIRSDGTPLEAYNNYPQIRTAGFTPRTVNWRWYSDVVNETPDPGSALANEEVAPIDIANTDVLALRVNVAELKNAQGNNMKFKLQFSDDISFTNPVDVVASSSCQERSLWCYVEGGAPDGSLISEAVLSGGSGCVGGVGAGCGIHTASPDLIPTHTHFGLATQEYSFTIRHVAARVNAIYYFRLYDVTNDVPVTTAMGYSLPSLVTEGPSLQLLLSGVVAGTSTAGVITDIATTPSGMQFGTLALNTDYIAAHRITVTTNATEGYQVLKFARQQLTGSTGTIVPPVLGSNLIPQSWALACSVGATGCVGYHTTDATLRNGSTRFAPLDTYAGLETTPVEVMYSSIPANDTHDIVYRIRVNELQPAGNYESEIVYLAIPSY